MRTSLQAANSKRSLAAADRDITDALLLWQPAIRDQLTELQKQVVNARLNLPVQYGWRDVATTIGLTKDQAAAAFRRARLVLEHGLSERTS